MKRHFIFNVTALAFVLLSNNGAWPEMIPGQDPVCEYVICVGNLLLALTLRPQKAHDGAGGRR